MKGLRGREKGGREERNAILAASFVKICSSSEGSRESSRENFWGGEKEKKRGFFFLQCWKRG